ncbi:LmeA family phospholipid-binding protein [Laspinema olomoucense]|uniref:LmeA family phospholipid-binding protein n=1 Tax=Laspinema olomoucense TaxID=3231600 RepID=UPI0021BA5274|nr:MULTISPECIES: DUF2993 domain-containing protein [unclassified Laspinema]MCT7974651.1 DUF2993 domain-containing protein [Laspinema sp. D3d]MCT7989247.1 DUF2993 domain-containing protein [Laspinema sp. D3a]
MREKEIIKLASVSSDRPELSPTPEGLPVTFPIPPSQSRIGWVLSRAVQLWLRSQVESVGELEVQINGGDRQILQGVIPQVSLSGSGVIYQGLHLSTLEVQGTGIQVNLMDIMRGKSLRLQDPVPVVARLHLTEADLNASMRSPLIADAFTPLFFPLFAAALFWNSEPTLTWQGAAILSSDETLIFQGSFHPPSQAAQPFLLETRLQLANPSKLHFLNPTIQILSDSAVIPLETVILPLGSDVAISELSFTESGLICQGELTVLP